LNLKEDGIIPEIRWINYTAALCMYMKEPTFM